MTVTEMKDKSTLLFFFGKGSSSSAGRLPRAWWVWMRRSVSSSGNFSSEGARKRRIIYIYKLWSLEITMSLPNSSGYSKFYESLRVLSSNHSASLWNYNCYFHVSSTTICSNQVYHKNLIHCLLAWVSESLDISPLSILATFSF